MKKSRVVLYLACFTILIIVLSLLPGSSLAAKDSSEYRNGNSNQYTREDILSLDKNKTDNVDEASSSKSYAKSEQKNLSEKSRDNISESKQERKQSKEDLQFYKQEYKVAKENFLTIRNRIREKELDPNSEEALNVTKIYLSSSISYMIAHLLNVKDNMAYSEGKGMEERITAIDEKIKLLEAEKAKVANSSSQEELSVVVKSVRGIWKNAEIDSISSAGQIVSEKIGEFLEESENLSIKLENKTLNLKETGVNTSELETKVSSYVSVIKSAQENKEEADSIYNGTNVTREDMQEANDYLRQSLSDINKANALLREIFGELKNYENKVSNKTEITNIVKVK
jgi:hypothetical protein